ncbi:MAG: TonB-dependent receptor [Bacteroidales bacterium]|nr:TonB-dependent receptor [Bacteroidales bacterium]
MDESNQPVVAAAVFVKGSVALGTQTDLDGKFTIEAPDNAELVVTCIGYVGQTVAVNGKTNITVTLAEDNELLSEVVVVGYGTQKKVNLTGAVSQVKMEDVLGDRPVINTAAALQGAVPGLTVSGGSSTNQAKSFSIRGDLSINGGSPLVLIDNVEGDINNLNPNDIESVSVLKDAASAAIYGARAAAGVILITTKQPKSGTKFTLNYNNNIGFLNSINCPEQASLTDYIDAYIEAGYNGNYWAGNGDVTKWKEYLAQYKANPSSLKTIGEGILPDGNNVYYFLNETNLFQNMLETGFFQNHNISVSGGSDKVRFRVSGGLNQVNGPLLTKKDSYGRKNVSAFVSADITKWFTQEATISYSDANKTDPTNGSFYTTRLINYYPSYFPGETVGRDHDVLSQVPASQLQQCPVTNNKTSVARIFLKSNFNILKGWTATLEYTYDRKDNNYNYYSTPYEQAEAQFAAKTIPETGQDIYEMSDDITKYNALNIYSTYQNTWGKHEFKAMAGFNQESSWYKYFYGSVLGQTVPSVPSFGGGTGTKNLKENYSEYAIRGGFARLNYAYDNRYLIELDARYDGSSKFPKTSRFGFFPSVSVGWRIGQEHWMEGTRNWLDELKLRASYGSIGNQKIDPYQFTSTMDIGQSTVWLDNGDKVTTISSPALVSAAFTWEKVTTLDLGLDFNAFQNRLQATFDYYVRKTTGMLAPGVEIPAVVGASAPLQNIADLKNRGWELAVSWRDGIGKDFAYHVGFNLYDNRTFIDKYNNESGLISDYYVGREFGEQWGYVSDGYYSINDFDLEKAKTGVWTLKEGVTAIQGVNVQPGDVKFKNIDGDENNIITSGEGTLKNPGDRRIIGNTTPRFRFGANLGISFKGLALDVMLQGVGKRDVWLGGASIYPFAGAGASDAVFQPLYYNQTDYWKAKSYDPESPDYMVAANPDASLFRIYGQGNNVGSNTRTSDKFKASGAYLRVKNLTLSYSFPHKLINAIRLSDLKLYASIENLATISSLPKGYDPETLSWSYPFYRTTTFGVSITF